MYNNPNFYGTSPMYYGNIGQMPQRVGLFKKLKTGVNWGNLLTNTSKTLNVINQAIPIFYQVKPLFQNAKTMFKIADIIKSDDEHQVPRKNEFSKKNYSATTKKEESSNSSNQPTFFL